MRRLAGALLLCVLASPPAHAGLDQPVDNVRYPTAGILAHREYRLQARLTPDNSVQGGARIGFRDRFQAGIFYGAQRLVDRGTPATNDHLGFEVRARLLDEGQWPGLVVGFDSQGWYEYSSADERYERKSLGFFVVASRNWRSFAGDLSVHAGGNYSMEKGDEDAPGLFGGLDWTIAGRVALLADAGTAWNDNTRDGRFGEGSLYLDAGLRVVLGENLSLMLVFSDLTRNLAPGEDVGREIEVVYVNWF